MIQLSRITKPKQLTSELQISLTEKFKSEKTSVWNLSFIKESLLKMSNDKCCYCECNINEESKYMEVEHFYCKDLYPNLVLDWDNLLPACKRCNGHKLNHDPKKEPIINPVENNPQNHLLLRNYRLFPKDKLGKITKIQFDIKIK